MLRHMQQSAERREFQRLTLNPPVPGTLGTTAVSILEIGVLGARVQHAERLDTEKGELRFSHRDGEIAMRCEIVRTIERAEKYPGAGLESGVRFVAALGESGDLLRDMLGDLVTKELANLRAMPAEGVGSAVDGDKTVRGKDAGYLCYQLDPGAKGGWSKRRIFIPEQPPVGFTVVRTTDTEEMQRLCAVYEASDEEGRRLIRLFAEISVSDALQIPPRA
jgi:hypothetical protein